MWRRGLSLLIATVTFLAVVMVTGSVLARTFVRPDVADGVRGVQPTGFKP
jgi:hypothetical protein